VSGSGISWAMYKSAPHSRQITMPEPHTQCLQAGCPSCRSTNSVKGTDSAVNNKPFLIWLLTTPQHIKYVATLPCNLSLMACFADINVSQGIVATYVMWLLITSLLQIYQGIFQWHNFVNRLRSDRITVISYCLQCLDTVGWVAGRASGV